LVISLISSGLTFPKQRAKIYFDPKGFSKLSISKTYRDLYLGMIPMFCEPLFYKHFANGLQTPFKNFIKNRRCSYLPYFKKILQKPYSLIELLSTSHGMIISEHLFHLSFGDARLAANDWPCVVR
jgi:hypothetical protein